MKLLTIFFSLLMYVGYSEACSIYFEEVKVRNRLIMEAANEFGVDLNQATSTKATGFNYQLYGHVPGSSCENFLEFQANVVIKYRPSLTQKCELSVQSILTENLQATSYPFEEVTFNAPASSCQYVPINIRPRPIPRPIPRRP